MNRLSGIDSARDIMPPKKLILNPPKNPAQQPTPRIKFTNVNKDITQPGIAVDEEARRRQDEHVRAASRGQVFSSTETPVRMAQLGTPSRVSAQFGTGPAGKVGAGSRRSASAASVGGINDHSNVPQDSDMKDAPANGDQPSVTSENQKSIQGMAPPAPMQPPAVILPQSHSAQVAHPSIARPAYQVTTAFDRIMRDPAKGRVLMVWHRSRELTVSQVSTMPYTHA